MLAQHPGLLAAARGVGFDVTLASAAMADDLGGRVHSHGTVLATVGDELLWVDTAMLTDRPFNVHFARFWAEASPATARQP